MKKIISFCHRTDRQGKGGVHKKYLLYFLKGGVHNFLLCLTCSLFLKFTVKFRTRADEDKGKFIDEFFKSLGFVAAVAHLPLFDMMLLLIRFFDEDVRVQDKYMAPVVEDRFLDLELVEEVSERNRV